MYITDTPHTYIHTYKSYVHTFMRSYSVHTYVCTYGRSMIYGMMENAYSWLCQMGLCIICHPTCDGKSISQPPPFWIILESEPRKFSMVLGSRHRIVKKMAARMANPFSYYQIRICVWLIFWSQPFYYFMILLRTIITTTTTISLPTIITSSHHHIIIIIIITTNNNNN